MLFENYISSVHVILLLLVDLFLYITYIINIIFSMYVEGALPLPLINVLS